MVTAGIVFTYDQGGEMALRKLSRRKPNIKNRIEASIEEALMQSAYDYPAFGFISPAGVCCVWLRHDLETFKKHLKALEAKVAHDGIILNKAQVAALEKANTWPERGMPKKQYEHQNSCT